MPTVSLQSERRGHQIGIGQDRFPRLTASHANQKQGTAAFDNPISIVRFSLCLIRLIISSHLAMFQSLAGSLPFLIAFVGLTLFAHMARNGVKIRTEVHEKASARIWLGTSAMLLVVGPVTHGLIALLHYRALPEDAMMGGWTLLGMMWLLLDWDKTWNKLNKNGPKWGYTNQSASLLIKFISGGVVLISYVLMVISTFGVEVFSRGRSTVP